MANPHSTVIYVEPNLAVGSMAFTNTDKTNGYVDDVWHSTGDTLERAPRLEDYCIALNLEVEVSSRDARGSKDVLILQWNNNDKDTVSFMGGSKIGGYEVENGVNKYRMAGGQRVLTTYYADMYVGDLVNYGTTEMIGIKSVNIQYEKSCVPMIDIVFTDVRGLSLFQPTELNRTNSYNGIKGINRENVAQSFFQCFFKMPLPKFTITIKGFYGKPVSYVMMCDKFETDFNSESGDYDVKTHFIGYNYSFMTDVSFDALLAAPYADFGNSGEKYWKDNVNNGRFYIWDKLKTKKMPMPTLYEMHIGIKELLNRSREELLDTTLTEEEKTHEEEIRKLEDIKRKYQNWYSSLFNLLKSKYNKRYCFEFKKIRSDKEEEWYKILILANENSTAENLGEDYKQYPEEFKTINNDLYAAIEEFNNSGVSYKQLKNISKDFTQYTRTELFEPCYVNHNTRKIEFGGFSNNFNGNKTEIVNRLFYNENTSNEEYKNLSSDEINKKKSEYKDFTLNSIYNTDGVNQYTYAYIIDIEYSDINRRINALTNDSKKSYDEKEKAKRRKEHNRLMLNNMNWYPSVENFTRITMAHLETLMMMIYDVQDKCNGRTPQSLGVEMNPDGNICDVNTSFNEVPPFPRVTKEEVGDDNITRKLDTWVGEFENGEGFIEVDMINSLFNAMEKLKEQKKNDEAALNSTGSTPPQPENRTCAVPQPLTSYDFFLTKNPYGSDNDISNNPNAFAGKVAMRMFMILAINNFKKELGDEWTFSNEELLKTLGRIEAENFYSLVKITNENMLKMLGTEGGEGTITPKSIIECVKTGEGIGEISDIPWKQNKDDKNNLFDEKFWLSRYTAHPKDMKNITTRIYPTQNMSYGNLEKSLTIFNKWNNSVDYSSDDIIVSYIDTTSTANSLIRNANDSCFGNIFIKEDYKIASDILETSNSSSNTSYGDIYNKLHDRMTFSQERYKNYVYPFGVFVPKGGINFSKNCSGYYTVKKVTIENKENKEPLYVKYDKNSKEILCDVKGSEVYPYVYDKSKLDSFASEAENKSISSWFFSECYSFYKENDNYYVLDKNKSFFANVDKDGKQKYLNEISNANGWKLGDEEDKIAGFFLMGLTAINYEAVLKWLCSHESFTYLPKLAVLQIGAYLTSLDSLNSIPENSNNWEIAAKNIPLPSMFHRVLPELAKLNNLTKIGYIKYYKSWVDTNYSRLKDELFSSSISKLKNSILVYTVEGGSNKRVLFREDSDFTKALADNLMSPVLVAKGNVNYFNTNSGKEEGLTFSETAAETYLRSFLERIKELYGKKGGGGEGIEAIRYAKDPNKVTDDMKQALYNYLKLLYDKWIPSAKREDWKFENFFPEGDDAQVTSRNGHTFYFIDSYYNKIGHKLLVNPMVVSEYIENVFDSKNVHGMLLGFLADIYGKNKCMLMCLQNFLDLYEDNAMSVMFKPIPYNAMIKSKGHPDFVVIYPYEPSKNLNVDNGEYNDDSFMLDEEFDTPIAIRSRKKDENCYQLPAFGVSYGKQYQSYFKNVKVGMASPIATQQSLIAKHAILMGASDKEPKGVQAQDLYDIYASQSYTCTVEMMGCAWVQPLMYFVLTNIPMFRGSYMIMKVTHKITPGNMTTEFTGCRMANVANRLIEEIFTDDFADDSIPSSTSYDDNKNRLADLDNDCPYRIFPLYEDEYTISKDEQENANHAMKILIEQYNFSKEAAAGICGNIFQESTWRLYVKDNVNAFGLCQWMDNEKYKSYRKSLLIKKYGERPTFEQQMEYINWEWQGGDKMAHSKLSKLNSSQTPEEAAEIVCDNFERPNKNLAHKETRKSKARAYFNNYKKDTSNETIKPNNKNIRMGLLKALQKSLDSTNKGVKIKMVEDKNVQGRFTILSDNGRLDLAFDILLNGYYQYIQTLEWVASDYLKEPNKLIVTAADKPDENNRRIFIIHSESSRNDDVNKKFGREPSNLYQPLLKSIYKKYKANKSNEIPQFDNMDIFQEIKIKDCNELMNGDEEVRKASKAVPNNANIIIDDWNVQKAVKWIIDNKLPQFGKGKCAAYVENAIQAGGIKRPYCTENGAPNKNATNLRYYHILEDHNFHIVYKDNCNPGENTKFDLQAGDICIIGHKDKGKYHACMWTGDRWYSDHKQNNMVSSNYPKSDAPYPYAIYRYGSGVAKPIS